MRYRVTRGLLALAVVGGGVGAVALVDRDPIGSTRTALADVRNSVEPVTPSRVSDVLPAGTASAYPPDLAVDGLLDSYWQTTVAASPDGLGSPCSEPTDLMPQNVLVLEFAEPTPLREMWVASGPPEGDPQSDVWSLPTAVIVAFDDGAACQRLSLEPKAEAQGLTLDQTASVVRLAVVAAEPDPQPDAAVSVGIAEVVLRGRSG